LAKASAAISTDILHFPARVPVVQVARAALGERRSDGESSLLPDGRVLVLGRDDAGTPGQNILREADLAGNPVRETNLDAINAELFQLGHDRIYGLNHEIQRLPNGTTVVLGFTERTVDIDGSPINYIGTMVVVLDQDLQVVWAWDAFDYLDVTGCIPTP
jgi:hypothetical protein